MTLRTKYALVCSCGHEGFIKLSENDQPYSSSYADYSVDQLNGGNFRSDKHVNWDTVFEHIRPTCPKCGYNFTKDDFHHAG